MEGRGGEGDGADRSDSLRGAGEGKWNSRGDRVRAMMISEENFETVGQGRPMNTSAGVAAQRQGLCFGNVGAIIVEFIVLVPRHRVIHRADYSHSRARFIDALPIFTPRPVSIILHRGFFRFAFNQSSSFLLSELLISTIIYIYSKYFAFFFFLTLINTFLMIREEVKLDNFKYKISF